MSWRGRLALVTGGGGFIGSHLVEALVAAGARVRVLEQYNAMGRCGWLDESPVKDRVDIRLGDVTDPGQTAAAMADVETVFHLAALISVPHSYEAPRAHVATNIGGTLNVLEAARSAGVKRIVHASSSEVYGTATRVPITEDHPLQGQSPYAASKIGADKLAEAYARSFGLPVVILRPFNTFGPRQSQRAIIPTIVAQALAGLDVRLGNLHPTRDLTYVDDTVRGFLLAAQRAGAVGKTINLGTGQETSIADLADRIIRLSGRRVRIVEDPQRIRPSGSEVERLVADAQRARDLLGWSPRVSLDDGLAATIRWFQTSPVALKPEAYVR